jgi:2',3'-cyclic-nucleotide 2'-phosphodiesterase (5'-nucleotidase family)
MGLAEDRRLARELQGEVAAILGAHSHNLLPEGERIGAVLVAQAGQFAEHLGRVDLAWTDAGLTALRALVLPVTEDIPPAPRVLDEVAAVERDLAQLLGEIIGELAQPLDFAADRECGVGDLGADMLRERMGAEIGVLAVGHAFTGSLPTGPLRRGTLWDVCSSPANPGVTMLSGAQVLTMVARGLDPVRAAHRSRYIRGAAQGLLHLSGAIVRDGQLFVGDSPVEADKNYRVAGTDWELDSAVAAFDPDAAGYCDPAWGNAVRYDVPVIVREALEEYLGRHRPVSVEMGRVEGAISV